MGTERSGRSRVLPRFVGHGEDLGFHSSCNGMPLDHEFIIAIRSYAPVGEAREVTSG